jgi:hypothetical protein
MRRALLQSGRYLRTCSGCTDFVLWQLCDTQPISRAIKGSRDIVTCRDRARLPHTDSIL